VKHILLINPNNDTFSNPVLFKIIEELHSAKSIKLTLVLTWQTTELPDIFKDVKIINLNQINVNFPLKFWKAIPTLLSTFYLVLYSKFQKVNTIVGVDSLGFILASRVKYWFRKISLHYFSFEIFFEEELSLFPADLKVKIKEKRYGKYLDCLVIQDRHRQELLLNENNWKDFNFKTFLLPVSYPLIQLDPTKRLEYRNKLGIEESEHIIIHSGSVATWSGGNYLVSLLKAGLGLNTKLLVHSKTKINPDNVILTELSKLSALGNPVILHDESFADYEDYLNFLQSIPHESIPTKVFFAFHDDKIIGKVNIRHKLNPQFESTDGHIGYGVNPAYRGLGHGTQMLQLSLEICRDLGLEKVLLICDEVNIASIKVIVKNGGILEESLDQSRGKKKRFWIKIS